MILGVVCFELGFDDDAVPFFLVGLVASDLAAATLAPEALFLAPLVDLGALEVDFGGAGFVRFDEVIEDGLVVVVVVVFCGVLLVLGFARTGFAEVTPVDADLLGLGFDVWELGLVSVGLARFGEPCLSCLSLLKDGTALVPGLGLDTIGPLEGTLPGRDRLGRPGFDRPFRDRGTPPTSPILDAAE